ncbi:hypothetical protein [Arthrobacter sp. HY1533]|uniref:hypothetical protein n=1 Tax=Arthrobacter sp. HY1533 TaxID=2970919 RepID=UPI0022B9D621|nr:hypothetical protein [Arthrobacter sp. HY1533]
MSFLAGLLRRELPPAPSATGALAGTTPAAAVVPRLASRFEAPGLPWWPGSGEQDAAFEGRGGTVAHPGNDFPGAAPHRHGDSTPDATAPRDPGRANMEAGGPRLTGGAAAPVGVRPPGEKPGAAGRATSSGRGIKATTGEAGRRETRPVVPPAPVAGAALPAARRLAQLTGENRPQAPLFPTAGEAGHLGRAAGVVNGLEWTGDHGPATHHHADGRPAWPDAVEGQVQPRLEPLARREPARAPEQHIHVSIGRIEVRAVAAAAPQPPTAGRAGLMSLDEYLRDRP